MPSSWSQEKYIKALRYAAAAHNGQTIPGSDLPYVIHVTMVTMEVQAALQHEADRDGDLAVQCALLHDVIEDTGKTFEELEMAFGSDVAVGVLGLSKDSTLDSKRDKMRDSLQRIKHLPEEIWMVKLADRITNLQPPPAHWSEEKINGYKEEARVILHELGGASAYLTKRFRDKLASYPGMLVAVPIRRGSLPEGGSCPQG